MVITHRRPPFNKSSHKGRVEANHPVQIMIVLPSRPLQQQQTRTKQKQRCMLNRVRSTTCIVLLLLAAASVPCCFCKEHSDAIQFGEYEIMQSWNLQQLQQSKHRVMIQEAIENTESPTVAPSTPIPILWRIKVTEQTVYETHLSDVWFCLIIALCWTVWVVAANVQPNVKRYAYEGILIKGHVLQATCDITGGSRYIGIPNYNAIIDYVFDDANGNTMQVRKTFQTEHFLEVGFANVDILVLPHDPLSGVLRLEWEKDYQKSISQHEIMQRHRNVALGLGVLLVLVVLMGAAHSVLHLPSNYRKYGWLSIGLALIIMWPCANIIYLLGRKIKTIATNSSNAGTLLRGQHATLQAKGGGNVSTFKTCGAFDTFDGLLSPSLPPTTSEIYGSGAQKIGDTITGDSEPKPIDIPQNDTYYVTMPTASIGERSDNESVSSMSCSSLQGSHHCYEESYPLAYHDAVEVYLTTICYQKCDEQSNSNTL